MWIADNKNGTYTNPILYTDYSDPDVCRVGDDYFMTASSFCNAPGLPVLHSVDLVNWELISYALREVPGAQYEMPLHGKGVWAPAIRYHDGEFIIFFPMPDEGIYVVKTKDPWGEWEEPICLIERKGWIDPCPLWDDDGKAYMVHGFARSRIGFKSVLNICEITPDCTKVVDFTSKINEEAPYREVTGAPLPGQIVFDGNANGQETIEGPKLYKRNGYYYIFAPAGGVKQGWQVVLRSKNIYGPYEFRTVMEQGSSDVNGPHQGAWVDTVASENKSLVQDKSLVHDDSQVQDWFLHFQDVYAAGRIVHLQPLRWVDDWPVIGEAADGETLGTPVKTYIKPTVNKASDIMCPPDSDEFNTESLGLQWQWNANPKSGWFRPRKDGLGLNAVYKSKENSISNVPNLLLQKWTMPEFRAVTKIDITGMKLHDVAGMVSLGVSYGAVAVEKTEEGFLLKTISGMQKFHDEQASAEDNIEVIDKLPSSTECIYFANVIKKVPSTQVNTEGKYTFPIPAQEISFEYSLDGTDYKQVLLYPALAGRWVGVKHGVFAYNETFDIAGSVKVRYFRYE